METKRIRCQKCQRNYPWTPGGSWCRNCDPSLAEQRKRNGSKRHSRFVRTLTVGGQDFDRAKAPTIALIVDKLLDIDQELDELVNTSAKDIAASRGDGDPAATLELVEAKRALLLGMAKVYSTRVAALKEARSALFDEREYARDTETDKPEDLSSRDTGLDLQETSDETQVQ